MTLRQYIDGAEIVPGAHVDIPTIARSGSHVITITIANDSEHVPITDMHIEANFPFSAPPLPAVLPPGARYDITMTLSGADLWDNAIRRLQDGDTAAPDRYVIRYTDVLDRGAMFGSPPPPPPAP